MYIIKVASTPQLSSLLLFSVCSQQYTDFFCIIVNVNGKRERRGLGNEATFSCIWVLFKFVVFSTAAEWHQQPDGSREDFQH